MEPVVSIVTPAYNASSTIEETFSSIKKQTYTNWEWIIVDDCSTDDTLKLIKEFQKEDSRVIVVESERNGGAAVARNLAIDKARGQYIAFLDADDMWHPTKLEKQLEFMIDNNYAISSTDYDLLLNGVLSSAYAIKKDVFNFKDMLKANNVGCSTVIYDSKMLGKVHMPLDAPKREDHAAWLDITKSGINIYKLNKSLTIYRVSNNSVSSKKMKMFKYQYRLYRNHMGYCAVKSFWLTLMLSFRKVFKKYKF